MMHSKTIRVLVLILGLTLACHSRGEEAGTEVKKLDEKPKSSIKLKNIDEKAGFKSVPTPTKEELKHIPQNLARWYTGASLYITHPNKQIERWDYNEAKKDARKYALLSDDPSVIYNINRGHHTFIVDLGGFYMLKTFHMQNYTARGTVVIYTSNVMHGADSPQWKLVGTPSYFKPGTVAQTSLGISEGRYVKIVFYIQQKGDIGPFHVSGTTPLSLRTVKSSEALGQSDTELVPFNIASLNTGSRVAMINAGDPEKANTILDEDPNTDYEIPPSNKPAYVLIDLQDYHNVHRVALDISGDPGLINFYLFDSPPDFVEEENPEEETQAKTENLPEAKDTTSFNFEFNIHDIKPLVLLAAEEGSIGEAAAIGQALEEKQEEESGFQRLAGDREPDFVGSTAGGDNQINFDFIPKRSRYVLIEWIQEGSIDPALQKGLSIREVAVMSEIPAPEFIQPPVEDASFASVGSTPDGGQPPLYTPPPPPEEPPTSTPPTPEPPPPPPPEDPTDPPTVSL